jgi:hypothetical protein
MATSVAHWPVAVFLPPSRPSSPNRMSPICLGLPRLNGRPASSWACCLEVDHAHGRTRELTAAQQVGIDLDAGPFSISASTAGRGRSSGLVDGEQVLLARQARPQDPPQPQGDVGVLGGVGGRRLEGRRA